MMRACTAAFVFSPRYLDYDFGPDHPMRPERQAALLDLLDETRLLRGRHIVRCEPPAASDEELALAHDAGYIAAVKGLSAGQGGINAGVFGLGEGDTPAFPGMHETAAVIAGGTLTAMRMVLGGEVAHAFNPGGGLHHAQRANASGFCIYNDLAVAIAAAAVEHEARVMYIDLDVHHGDGVQAAFYDDPRVLTISIHETGRYLFPGTGAVPELGAGAGIGFSINVPLAAFTEDASWLEAVTALLPPLAERFRPDLIVSQHGCDGHIWDGQSHLLLTVRAYQESARLVHRLAHEYCGGRWIATGGGGYDPVRVVPRAWAGVWAEMAGRRLPARIPEGWLARQQPLAEGPIPEGFADPPDIVPEIPRRPAIEEENRATVRRVRDLALSPQLRQAYRPAGAWTPAAVAAFPPGRSEQLLLPASATAGERRVLLRERAPVSLLRRLLVAEDMHSFAASAERESGLLRRIAARPDASVTVAHTPAGEIVGEVTLAPADGRWFGIDGIFELAIEVARSWRGAGLAGRMLGFVLAPDYIEDLIVMAIGLSWHWDLKGLDLRPAAYREVLLRVFRPFGFVVYPTDDPEVAATEGNVLVARVGSRVPHELIEQFERQLDRRQSWYGFR